MKIILLRDLAQSIASRTLFINTLPAPWKQEVTGPAILCQMLNFKDGETSPKEEPWKTAHALGEDGVYIGACPTTVGDVLEFSAQSAQPSGTSQNQKGWAQENSLPFAPSPPFPSEY